jgi:hypothetical protein
VSDKDLLPDVLPRTATTLLAPLQTQLQKRLAQPLMTYSGRLLRSMEVTWTALGRGGGCPPSHSNPVCCLLWRRQQCKLTRHHPCQRRCRVAALSSGGDVWRVPREGCARQVSAWRIKATKHRVSIFAACCSATAPGQPAYLSPLDSEHQYVIHHACTRTRACVYTHTHTHEYAHTHKPTQAHTSYPGSTWQGLS